MTAANYLELAGVRVTSCTVTIPMTGTWVADVTLESDLPLASPKGLLLTIGNLPLVGSVVPGHEDAFAGTRAVRLAGGFGGWSNPLPPLAYKNPAGVSAALVLSDAAIQAGETLVGAPPTPLGQDYVREAGPARETLRRLLGPTWWVDAAGVTHALPRPPGHPIASEYSIEEYDGDLGRLVAATEDIASWQPGAIVAGPFTPSPLRISSVTIRASDDGILRVEALVEPVALPSGDRLLDALRSLIRREIESLSYRGVWEYQVTEARIDDTTGASVVTGFPVAAFLSLPPLVDVALRPTLPGFSTELLPGSTVLVAFVDGNPARPMVLACDGNPGVSLLLSKRPLALADDLQVWAAGVVTACAGAHPPIVVPPLPPTVSTQAIVPGGG